MIWSFNFQNSILLYLPDWEEKTSVNSVKTTGIVAESTSHMVTCFCVCLICWDKVYSISCPFEFSQIAKSQIKKLPVHLCFHLDNFPLALFPINSFISLINHLSSSCTLNFSFIPYFLVLQNGSLISDCFSLRWYLGKCLHPKVSEPCYCNCGFGLTCIFRHSVLSIAN